MQLHCILVPFIHCAVMIPSQHIRSTKGRCFTDGCEGQSDVWNGFLKHNVKVIALHSGKWATEQTVMDNYKIISGMKM